MMDFRRPGNRHGGAGLLSQSHRDINDERYRELRRPRKIRFFSNGDRFFRGKQLNITPHRYLGFNDLLSDLTSKLPNTLHLPYGVRQIFTPAGGTRIRDIEQLQDGRQYVCAGFEPFKCITYGKHELEPWSNGRSNQNDHFPADFNNETGHGPHVHLYGSSGVYGGFHPGRHYRPIFQKGRVPPSNFRYGNRNSYLVSNREDVNVKPKVITLVRYGPRPRNIVKILLNKRSVQSFEHLLKDISESFGPKWKNNKVRKVFTTKGKEVLGVSDFFRDDDLFIAIGADTLSVNDIADILDEVYPNTPYAKRYLREWEKQKKRRKREQKQELGAEQHDTKGDSGFVESENGKDEDLIYKPKPFEGSPSPHGAKDESSRENDILLKMETERKRAAEEKINQIRKRREKNMEAERRAMEDEKRRLALVKDPEHEREKKMAAEEERRRKEEEEQRKKKEQDTEEKQKFDEEENILAENQKDKIDQGEKKDEQKDGHENNEDKENVQMEKQKSKSSVKIQRRRHSKARRRSIVKSNKLQRRVSDAQHILDKYETGRVLGDGNFAVVKQARLKNSNNEYAMKIIDKSKLKGKEHMIENEIEIMKRCNHPNLVKLKEEFETVDEIYLIMELVKGGDLFDAITQSVKFSEKEAALMIKDLTSALFYMHSRRVVHRDMKPENLLVQRNKDGSMTLKLADFGLAMDVRSPIFTVCGTPTYVAPEILSEIGYGLEIDMWAIGVIAYILLCGFPPFRSPDRNQTELFEFIKAGEYEFLSPYWDKISRSAKDLIENLLIVEKRKRYTAIDVLCHPWIITLASSIPPPDNMADYRRKLREELQTHAQLALDSYRKQYYPPDIKQ